MTTSQNEEEQSVVVSGEDWHGKHHCEVLIMNRDADGPGGSGNYYNSLGVVDEVPDEEFDARFRYLDPEKLRQEYGRDAVRFNGPRSFLADRFTARAFDGGTLSMLGRIPMYLYGTFMAPDFDAFIAAVCRDRLEAHHHMGLRGRLRGVRAGLPRWDRLRHAERLAGSGPDNTVDRLPTLGERLALPEG